MVFEQQDGSRSSNVSEAQRTWRPVAVGILLLATGALSAATHRIADADEPPRQTFRFVQICDTQLGFGAMGYDADLKSFQQAVRQVNAMKPDFVVICGDLVNTPEAKAFADFKNVLAKCNVPCHCAAGNHDIGHPIKPTLLENYRQTIGRDYYHFQHKGYTFVVVNTELWKSPTEHETARHETWFEQTLDAAKKQDSPVFVVGHHPLFLNTADEKEQYFNIPPAQRKRVLNLFSKHGVVAMLGGHAHRLVAVDYKGIKFLCGETTSKNFDKRPLGFRVWTVDSSSGLRHEFEALETQPKPDD